MAKKSRISESRRAGEARSRSAPIAVLFCNWPAAQSPTPLLERLGALYVAVLSEQKRADVEIHFAELSKVRQDHTTSLAQVLAALVVLSPNADKNRTNWPSDTRDR